MLVIGQRGRSSRMIARDDLLQPPTRDNQILAVFDGSPSAFRAIELANTLAVSASAGAHRLGFGESR